MKKLITLFLLLCAVAVFAQAQSVTLTFTGRDANNHFIPLNRVVIGNVTQNWQETIYYPDTILVMGGTGVEDMGTMCASSLRLSQNNPNPFDGTTFVNLEVAEPGDVAIEITDITGRIVETMCTSSLQPGIHEMRITLSSPGIYFLTARQNGRMASVKMVNRGNGGGDAVTVVGIVETFHETSLPQAKNAHRGATGNPFNLGDEMIYIGYVIVNGVEYTSQTVHQNQVVSENIVLNFDITSPTGLATVTTDAVANITGTTATCGGNVTADGGYSVIARGVCWSTSPNPVFNDSHISNGDGLGAFTCQLANLSEGTTYYVRAYAVNSVGTAYGNQVSFTTTTNTDGQPCPGAATVTDYDGNVYNTVQIGDQCWTRENLRVTHYSDGTPIPAGGNNYSYTDPYYYDYSSSGIPLSERGYLYNWPAAMHSAASSSAVPSGVQGVCPLGWHMPSDAEWTQLTNYVGSVSEYQCSGSSGNIAKALASTTGWNTSTYSCAVGNDQSVNNASGFGTVPAGQWGGGFSTAGYGANFWSSTEDIGYGAYCRVLGCDNADVYRGYNGELNGVSVRCLRDSTGGGGSSASLPTVTTGTVSNIAATSATCGGNVTSDGGATVSARGVCWSTSQNPTVSGSHTTDGSGTGSFTSNITGLTANTTYYVRAYATNSAGTAYGAEVSFTTTTIPDVQPCPGAATVTDYDGNVYNTVQIGDQCWTRENLRVTHYSDGTPIPAGGNNYSYTDPYYYDYSSSGIPLSERGYLYNWPAAMHSAASSSAVPSGVQGVCPNGWHLPSDAEWTQLTDYVGSVSEYQCGGSSGSIAKALASTTWWNTSTDWCAVGNDQSVNNASGFGAVPAGNWNDGFYYAGYIADFWSSTEGGGYGAYGRYLYYNGAYVYSSYSYDKTNGFSVRCLRDSTGGGGSSASLPTVTTGTVSNIAATSATCGGNVTSDGGATVSARGVCWSTSQNPTVSGSHTTDGSGTGSFTSNITGLTANTTYYVRAYATNSAGTAYGAEVSFTTIGGGTLQDGQLCPGTPTVTDYDGNVYNTVQIGNQCWTRENLRVTHYSDGTPIPAGVGNFSYTAPYYYDYSNSGIPLSERGYLYNWAAAMHSAASSSAVPSGVQGVCPTGWHLPSDAEWTVLTDYVSSVSEYQCGSSNNIAKALASTTGWNTTTSYCAVGNDQSTNNASGFGTVPAGYWYGGFLDAGYVAIFWSSTEYNSDLAYSRHLGYDGAYVSRINYTKANGFSVRCLRD